MTTTPYDSEGRPSFPNMHSGALDDPYWLTQIINSTINGKLNTVHDITIANGQSSLVVDDELCSVFSFIQLMPKNSEARSATWYITAADAQFTITLASATGADAEFRYALLG
jgi:hypothetical protein